MLDDEIIGCTDGALGLVYADAAKRWLYCMAECPPLGKIRLDMHSDAFGMDLESSMDADGAVLLNVKHTFLQTKAFEAVAMLDRLNPPWPVLWARVYQALLQVRKDYGRTAEITKENCSLVLTPPDADTEHWWCELQLDDWDGFYSVQFNPDGEIIDACASF